MRLHYGHSFYFSIWPWDRETAKCVAVRARRLDDCENGRVDVVCALTHTSLLHCMFCRIDDNDDDDDDGTNHDGDGVCFIFFSCLRIFSIIALSTANLSQTELTRQMEYLLCACAHYVGGEKGVFCTGIMHSLMATCRGEIVFFFSQSGSSVCWFDYSVRSHAFYRFFFSPRKWNKRQNTQNNRKYSVNGRA